MGGGLGASAGAVGRGVMNLVNYEFWGGCGWAGAWGICVDGWLWVIFMGYFYGYFYVLLVRDRDNDIGYGGKGEQRKEGRGRKEGKEMEGKEHSFNQQDTNTHSHTLLHPTTPQPTTLQKDSTNDPQKTLK